MKRLLLLIIVLSAIGVSAQKIEDLPRASAATGLDLLIVDQSDATRGISVTNFFNSVPGDVIWVSSENTTATETGTMLFPYNTVQEAVDVCTGGETVLVCPGTYTEAVAFGASNITVQGMGAGNDIIIQQASATVIIGGAYTGNYVRDINIRVTAATSAVVGITVSTGDLTFHHCKTEFTQATGAPGHVANSTGVGDITFVFGKVLYKNTTTTAGNKYCFGLGTTGTLTCKYMDEISMYCSGNSSSFTSLGIDSGNGSFNYYKNKDIIVQDTTATSVYGLAKVAHTGTHEMYRNNVHVTAFATDATAYGVYMAAGGAIRSSYNHWHILSTGSGGGETALSFFTSSGTLASQMDDIVAADGYTGSVTMIASQADGDLTATGTITTADAIITNMATVTTTVLTPTSTGLIDTLETTDIATADMTVTGLWTFDNIVVDSIDADTISVDYIEVNTMFNWNPPHAHLAFHDSAETLTMTSGVWTQVTNTEHTLFIEEELVNMTFAGDSLTIDAGYGGDYVVNLGLSFAGTASDDWEICLFKNNAILGVIMEVETGGTNNTYVGLPTYLDAVVPGDDIKFMIRNTASDDDAVILACSWIIYFLHP